MCKIVNLFIFFIYSLFYFVSCYGMPNNYNRSIPSFSRSYANTLSTASKEDLVSEFKQCSRNIVSSNLVKLSTIQQVSIIDSRLDPVLDAVAQNATGASMLKWIVLNVKPFVDCALSLYEVSKTLEKNNQDSIHCVLNFVNDLKEFHDYASFSNSVAKVQNSLDAFLVSPRKVIAKVQRDGLDKLGLDNLINKQQVMSYLKESLIVRIKDAINNLIPLLIDCTYELVMGTNQFDVAGKKFP